MTAVTCEESGRLPEIRTAELHCTPPASGTGRAGPPETRFAAPAPLVGRRLRPKVSDVPNRRAKRHNLDRLSRNSKQEAMAHTLRIQAACGSQHSLGGVCPGPSAATDARGPGGPSTCGPRRIRRDHAAGAREPRPPFRRRRRAKNLAPKQICAPFRWRSDGTNASLWGRSGSS